jgi:hypothetical protein
MNNNNNNNNIIHCKLAFNGQNRRFSFYGTEFTQLREQVSQLIGLPINGFVLKYVDNESDLITVSSNEEFAIALAISEKVLRLKAESISSSNPSSAPSSPLVEDCAGGHHHHKMQHHHGHHGHGNHGHHDNLGHHGHYGHQGNHGHHGQHGHHGKHGHHGHGRNHNKGDRSLSKCDRKEKKMELLKLFLSQMPPDESLTPAQASRKEHLRQKIQKLESRRAHWSEKEEKCKRRKWEKKCKKDHQKSQLLSPEANQQVLQLKLQILALRPELCQLRLSQKQKKLELRNCLQTGCGDKDVIWQEILDLKVKMNQMKSQIQPLKQSVKDLKASVKQQ